MRYDTDYTPEQGDFTPVPEGDYPFTIMGATDSTSKAGNGMIELELAVDVGRQQDLTIYDRLVSTPKALWKIHQFCHAVGLNFDDGEIVADTVRGLSGKARFACGEAKTEGKSAGKRFLEVKWYVNKDRPAGKPKEMPAKPPAMPRSSRVTAPPDVNETMPTGSDIPF